MMSMVSTEDYTAVAQIHQPFKEDIVKSVRTAISANFAKNLEGIELPFGNGDTSDKIVEICLSAWQSGKLNAKKRSMIFNRIANGAIGEGEDKYQNNYR